ncbi:MAG: hypothetical protein L0G46_09990, partial [Kocuria sp.]|nr:hypothetical protein [Kocuria sp.]
MVRYAVLAGTSKRPRIELDFPAGPAGERCAARLRDALGFEVDAEAGQCVTHAPTRRLIGQLREAGIVLDAFEFPETLASLARPLVVDAGQGRTAVYPRLAGRASVAFDLDEDARFDPDTGCFHAPRSAVADWPDYLLPATLRGQATTASTTGQIGEQGTLD